MTARPLVSVAAALVVLLLTTGAAADPYLPPLHLMTGATLRTEGGSELHLPPDSVILLPETWTELDIEVRRLQDAETRLTAERDSLRKSAHSSLWSWRTLSVAGALVTGVGIGIAWQTFRDR